ncbi:MAG: substrate-binding domain-containing protein [Spirochaetales bacterium]|nr:substrate-binding domain-containing protein [Spirochaetales bacterium]
MKRIMLVLVIALVAVTMAMAGGTTEKAAEGKEGGFDIAVSNSFIAHSWRTQMVNNLQKAVAYYQGQGLVDNFYIQHSGPDLDLQINQVRNFVNQGVDLLIIDPLSNTALNPALEEAMEAGVLVIVSDEPVTSTEVWQVMPTHDVWMEKLARYVFDRMGGKGKLVYLSGIDGAPASDQRDDGFYRALKDYPNIELLTQAFGFWDPARSQQTMADVLAAYPQIDGVVAQDGQCLATIRAFQAANREAPVINADGFRPMMEYWAENVDKGFTSFAIANGPGFAMTCSLGVGVRMLQGREIKPELLKGKVLNLDHTNIITDANVKEQLAEHTRLRGLEDYVDEIWSQEKLDSLFVE